MKKTEKVFTKPVTATELKARYAEAKRLSGIRQEEMMRTDPARIKAGKMMMKIFEKLQKKANPDGMGLK